MKKTFYLLIAFVLLDGCAQLAPKSPEKVSPFSGKLQSITLSDSNGVAAYTYRFYYDSISGELTQMIREPDDTVLLRKLSKQTLQLFYHYHHADSGTDTRFILYAYLNSQNYLEQVSYDYPENAAAALFRFVLKPDHAIDTIIEPPVTISDTVYYFKDFDIVSDGYNYTQLKTLTESKYSSVTDTSTGLTDIQYASCSSKISMPGRFVFELLPSRGWYLDEIGPVYILSVAGYLPYKPNRNLFDFVNGNTYSYAFDGNQRITEIKISPANRNYLVSYY